MCLYDVICHEKRLYMKNFFDVLPHNFFNIFFNDNKLEASDCLLTLYRQLTDELEYTLEKDHAVSLLESYFKGKLLGDTGDIKQTPRERALFFLKRFKECGWTIEEIRRNYRVYVSLSDIAISFIRFVEGIEKDSELIYSSQTYAVYREFKSFESSKGELIVDSAYKNTKDLMDSLKKLNTNIKKYIQKLLSDTIRDDLNQLITILTSEYQMRIVDRAYYNLTTKDHPSKYRGTILESIQTILSNASVMDEMAQRSISDTTDYATALEELSRKLSYIHHQFESIGDLLAEINSKNQKFVTSAIGRIHFLLDETTDIEGSINTILKKLPGATDYEWESFLTKVALFDVDSQAKPRELIQKSPSLISTENQLSDEEKTNIAQAVYGMDEYSPWKIESYVNGLLKGKKEIRASDSLGNDRLHVLFIYIYGFSQDSPYHVKRTGTTYRIGSTIFSDYVISRRTRT